MSDSPRYDLLQDPKNVAHVSDLKGAQARANLSVWMS